MFRAHAHVQEPNLSMNVPVESVFSLGNFSPDQTEVRNRTWPFLLTLMSSGTLSLSAAECSALLAAVCVPVGTSVLCA